MSSVRWEPVGEQFCGRGAQQVSLEAERVYPAEQMPDQPSQVLAHRPILGKVRNLFDQPACCWSGTQPGNGPLA